MIVLSAFAEPQNGIDRILRLPFEKRQKSRLRTRLVSGEEVGVNLPRGSVLRSGDCLLSEDGCLVLVQAETEQTSLVVSDDPHLLLRAAYHLGNRHVPLQIELSGLRYLSDHVLDEMVRQLGLTVIHEAAPFEPEHGAYAGHHAHG